MAKENISDTYGLTSDQAEQTKDVTPGYNWTNIPVGESRQFTITEAKPREVEIKDQDEPNEVRKTLVINAIDHQTEVEVALWLSSVSIRREFFKLAQKKANNLKDTKITVLAREYEHKKYGKTRGYTVAEVLTK